MGWAMAEEAGLKWRWGPLKEVPGVPRSACAGGRQGADQLTLGWGCCGVSTPCPFCSAL